MKYSQEEIKKMELILSKLPPEQLNQLKEKSEMLQKHLPILLQITSGTIKSDDLAQLGVLGSIGREYCEKFKCSIVEFAKDVKQSCQFWREYMIEQSFKQSGVKSEKKKREIKHIDFPDESIKTGTIGDMLKAKGQYDQVMK